VAILPRLNPSNEYALASHASIRFASFWTNAGVTIVRPVDSHVNAPWAGPVGPVPDEFDRDWMVEGRYGMGKLSIPDCVLIVSKTDCQTNPPFPFAALRYDVEIGRFVLGSIEYKS